MATTLDILEGRLTALEKEVALLREAMNCQSAAETPAKRGEELTRLAERSQAAISAAIARAYADMGIAGQAIGAEKLQEMLIACGIKPEQNAFSRGIIEMREE